MPNPGKITPKQIELARKILAIVPPKDNSCTREEAGEVLAKDFKLAFKKGYSPREIAAMLKVYGIIIPASVVAKYEGPETEQKIDVNRLLEASSKCSHKKVRSTFSKSQVEAPQDHSCIDRKEASEQMEEAAPNSEDQDFAVGKDLCGQTNSNATITVIPDGQTTCGTPEIQNSLDEKKGVAEEKIESSVDMVKAAVPATKNVSAPENSVPSAQKNQPHSNKNEMGKSEKAQLQMNTKQPEAGKNPWDIDLSDWCGPAKINPANYGTFKIKPDTPKGEL